VRGLFGWAKIIGVKRGGGGKGKLRHSAMVKGYLERMSKGCTKKMGQEVRIR